MPDDHARQAAEEISTWKFTNLTGNVSTLQAAFPRNDLLERFQDVISRRIAEAVAAATERLKADLESAEVFKSAAVRLADERDALRAERAGDHGPVDAEWLKSVGFEQEAERPKWYHLGDDLTVCFGTERTPWFARHVLDYDPKCYVPSDCDLPPDRNTTRSIPSGLWPSSRADVLALMRLLGCERKDST